MELQLNRSKLKVGIYGSQYELLKPTLKEAELYRVEAEKAEKNGTQLALVTRFLVTRGLPKEVVEGLELDHFMQITEALLGVKKN